MPIVACFHQSLIIHRELNDPRCKGTTLADIGDVYQAWGRIEEARDYWRQAFPILEQLSGPDWVSRTAQLREILSNTDV